MFDDKQGQTNYCVVKLKVIADLGVEYRKLFFTLKVQLHVDSKTFQLKLNLGEEDKRIHASCSVRHYIELNALC